MKTKILQCLSFLMIAFYNISAFASGVGTGTQGSSALADLEKLLIENKTEKAFRDYLYFDGVRLWVILAAAIIAVNVINLASDIGKDLGGAPLGGSVGGSVQKIGGGLAEAGIKKGLPFAGKQLAKGIKKLNNIELKNPFSGGQSTASAGAKDFEGATKSSDNQSKPEQDAKPKQEAKTNANPPESSSSASETPHPDTKAGVGNESSAGGEETTVGAAVATGGALAKKGMNAAKENVSKINSSETDNVPSVDVDTEKDTDTKTQNTQTQKKAEMPGRGAGSNLAEKTKKDTEKIAEEKANRVKDTLRAEYTERINQESSRLAGNISAVSSSINSAINDKVAPVVSVSNEALSVSHQATNRKISVSSVEVSKFSKPEDMSKRIETPKK